MYTLWIFFLSLFWVQFPLNFFDFRVNEKEILTKDDEDESHDEDDDEKDVRPWKLLPRYRWSAQLTV